MSHASGIWLAERRAERSLAGMVVLSGLLHVGAFVGIYLLPARLFSSSPPPVIAYTVNIVDPGALGGRLPKGPLEPEKAPSGTVETGKEKKPEPAEERKEKSSEEKPEPPPEVKEEKTVVLPEAKAKPEPTPVEKKPPEQKPQNPKSEKKKPSKEEVTRLEVDRRIQEAVRRLGEKGKAQSAAGLGGREEGKGAALGVGGDGGGGGILMGLDFILYKNQVEEIIRKNWTWVGSNPDLTVRVEFGIRDNGEIRDPKVAQSSGDRSYDESVMQAIRASSPLPPPPEKYRDVFSNYRIDFVSGELAAQSG